MSQQPASTIRHLFFFFVVFVVVGWNGTVVAEASHSTTGFLREPDWSHRGADRDEGLYFSSASAGSSPPQAGRHRHLNRVVARRNPRLWMILVRWADHATRTLPPLSYFQELCNGSTGTTSLATYFGEQGNGIFGIRDCLVSDWTMTDQTEAQAMVFSGTPGIQNAFVNALNQIEQPLAAANALWWTDYDITFDGQFDLVLVVHSGYPLTTLTTTADCQGVIVNDGYLGFPVGTAGWTTSDGLCQLQAFGIVSAFQTGACSSPPVALGTAANAVIRTLQTYELYDPTLLAQNQQLGGIGLYGLLSANQEIADGANPGSVSPWTKELLQWVNPTVVTTDGAYQLDKVDPFQRVYRINKGFAANEYLLIEYRENTGVDSNLPASGVLIYHIDNTNFQDAATKRLNVGSAFPGQADWPARHYEVALVQADGNFDLEQGVNSGDAGDFWMVDMILGPSGTAGTEPNTDSYTMGETGVSIKILSIGTGTATFFVSGVSDVPVPFPTTPVPSTAPVVGVVPTTTPPTTIPGETVVPTVTPTTGAPSISLHPSQQPSQSSAPSSTPRPSQRAADAQLDLGVFNLVASPATLDKNALGTAVSSYLTAAMLPTYSNLLRVTVTSTTNTARNLVVWTDKAETEGRWLQEATTSTSYEYASIADFSGTAPALASVLASQQIALENTAALKTSLDASPQLTAQLNGAAVVITRVAADGPGQRGSGTVRGTTSGATSCIRTTATTTWGLVIAVGVVILFW